MTDKNTQSADAAAEKELEGVPEHMKDDASEATDAADAKIAALEDALATAQQEVRMPQLALPATFCPSPTIWRVRWKRSPPKCARASR